MRRAKARAAATGQTLTRLITEALAEKLAKPAGRGRKPWMQLAGALRHDRAESRRILRCIEREFEVVEPEIGQCSSIIRHGLRMAGTPIPANDTWIAALAREHALPILSRNAHFDAVRDVHRLEW